MNENEYQQRIEQLEREVADLKTKLTAKQKTTRYGLVWEDVPEAFEKEAENKIPILEEVKDKAIKNDDGKPTHILIEGDNYHALQCLNYTHRGKVDVIYIDPPYNTGSDGFTYKDKRFLDQFPNGTTIPKEHPLRHSTWLSFMSKRLELAKNLLSEKGVIFISIDDNEQANLKLLCDKVFGEDSFVTTIHVEMSATQGM
ncbi:MAG: site-specific DNA-methyltransferase, partial [Bacteroidales bacterium]|nr:site-specific DNA-methyltransferase [Bacteroidales bacterium]